MTGIICNNHEIKAIGNYTVDLQCLEFYTVGTGKQSRTETKVHWQSKQQVDYLGKSSKNWIPFSFEIPSYPPETGYQLARGNINWQLRIDVLVEGVDHFAIFSVPVFKMDHTN